MHEKFSFIRDLSLNKIINYLLNKTKNSSNENIFISILYHLTNEKKLVFLVGLIILTRYLYTKRKKS